MKTAKFDMRISPDLLAQIQIAADAEGLSTSAWVTRLVTLAIRHRPLK